MNSESTHLLGGAALPWCVSFCLLTGACSSDTTHASAVDAGDTGDAEGTGDAGTEDNDPRCPVVVRDADCDANLRPIVFVHGLYGSGDNIANVALLMTSNGFCADRFYALDYESLNMNAQPGTNGVLDAFIDQVLAETGADKVELMGHSNGSVNSRNYLLQDGTGDPIAEHAAKVAHYIHLAGGPLPVPAEPPTLCVASNSDTIATGLCPAQAAESLVFEEKDHFAVASSDETFVAIYKFLRGEDPEYTTIQCGDSMVKLELKMESFADNVIPVGNRVELHELDDDSDPRERGAPVATFTVGEDGLVGPVEVKRLQQYEFAALDPQGNVIGHQYVSPLKRSNLWVRALMPSEALAIVTDSIVTSEGHSAIIARSYKGAFRKDLGDSLKVNGTEVLAEEFSNATSSTVGLFLFDDNENGTSDGGNLSAYSALPFIRGTDVFMDASTPGFIELDYNGTVMQIPNWPSASGGPSVVIFP